MPDYGKDMPDQTVVYFAHDAENLYFAFRALDSEPGRIKASIAARDGITADDWICINLDSFGDQQSLYALYVNPRGIQGDSRFAAGREDFGFDAVWYSAGRVDDKGYAIEVRIPFNSLRYGETDPVRMALIFERRVSRRSEHGTYPPLDPKVGPNFLTQNVPIEFAGIRHYRLVEILPDAVYDCGIYRAKATYQWNRYLFFRGIGEYNTYRRQLLTDFLASFTYIPGTVFHVGYGSFYEKLQWQTDRYVPGRDLLETRRGFFLKLSYLWRL
jgi:hypothetical protein